MRLTACLLALAALAAAAPASAASDEGGFDAVHHTADGTYLDFEPFGKLELPRLFVVRRADGSLGFDAFGSTRAALLSGRYVAVPEGGHGSTEQAHGEGTGAAHEGDAHDASHPIDGGIDELEIRAGDGEGDRVAYELVDAGTYYDAHLAPAGGGAVLLDLSVTRHYVFALLAALVLLALFLPVAGRYKRGVGRTSAPRGLLQNVLETVVIYVRDEIAKPNLGDKYRPYLPYLLTVFFFILVANLLGLVPFGATATSNIAVTGVLAVFTFVVTQFAGTKDYWLHVLWPPGVPTAIKPILIPVEILGLFTKPFALAIRLFANMTAGHLVILNLIGLIFIIGNLFGDAAGYMTSPVSVAFSLFIYLLELLVAFIQAYVFTVLSALFIGMATAEHEHDHDHAEDHGLTAHDLAVSQSNGQAAHKQHGREVGTEAVMA